MFPARTETEATPFSTSIRMPFRRARSSSAAPAPADVNKGGLLYNVISRSGTNQLHGGATFNGIEQRMNAENITPALRTELLAGLNPAARALAQDRFVGNEILKLYDYGAWVGGPVIRDRLWFSGSTHIQGMDQYPLGSFDAAANPVIDDYLMSTTTAKISWQMTKSAQLSYFDNLHYKGVYHRNGVGNNNTNFSDNLARTLNTKWPNVQQVKFTTPYRSSFVIDVAYARLRDDDRFDPRPEVSNGAISRFDSLHQHVHRSVADLQFQSAQARSGAREHQLLHAASTTSGPDTGSSSTASRRRSGRPRRCARFIATA